MPQTNRRRIQANAYRIHPSSSRPTLHWSADAVRGDHFDKSLADAQLDQMKGLNVNWELEGAEPPNATARAHARLVLTVADIMSISVEYVMAAASGGVVVCFSRGEIYTDIECYNSGEMWGIVAYRGESPRTWCLTPDRQSIEDALRLISMDVPVNA
jgi:DNA-binding NarL/FixJ family response regulator